MTQTETTQNTAQIIHPHIVPAFLSWYFIERPREIVSSYLRYAGAFSESFAMFFMLKTLLSPWKSITDDYPSRGLNVEAILATFFLNLTSRAIGLVFRMTTIVTGILIQIALLCGFMAYLMLWISYPIFLIFALPLLISLLF